MGPRSGKGYGSLSIRGKTVYAHRVFYEYLVGPIPDGMQLDHVAERGCQHPHCVNPDHLEPVTNAVNTQRGHIAKLTIAHAATIRFLAGRKSRREIAEQFGISVWAVDDVISGKTWKDHDSASG
jgi:hypothetical protein